MKSQSCRRGKIGKIRPYQVEAVKYILDKKRVLIADDMGLGKTAESIVAKTAIDNRVGSTGGTLVVCPASVMQHWENEIKSWYSKKEDTKVIRIETSSYDEDIKRAESSDFVVVGYPTLSSLGGTSRLDLLKNMNFQYGIIDEAHNAKNPESLRSGAVRNLFHGMDYLAVLSGTPIPNTVVDIYALLNLLDKEQFPINEEGAKHILTQFYTLFRKNPAAISKVISEHRIRRFAEHYLSTTFPKLNQKNFDVILQGDHREVYLDIYQNNSFEPGAKLSYLVAASIDPNLISPQFLSPGLASRVGKMESSVYKALDDLIAGIVSQNGKALIFSGLKRGVTDHLVRRYNQYGALVIDSDVPSTSPSGELSLREKIRNKFQGNPKNKVLIATTVMDEGVDLTGATDVIHLTLPYTPAAFDQRNRRSQRIGEVEKDKVNVHVVMPRFESLLPIITEGISKLLDDKRRIIEYIEQEPFSLTERDLEGIKDGHAEKSVHLAPIIKSPMHSVIYHFGQLKCQGFKKILEHYEKYPEEADYIARIYSSCWDGYYWGNTAKLYSRVINIIDKENNLERKLDIASGPFSLSRSILQRVTNVDINKRMLDAGKVLEQQGKIVPGNTALQAPFHEIPLKGKSFDLSVCSLALHLSKPLINLNNDRIHERELVFREMNRLLRDQGYSIVTLPYTAITESDLSGFYHSLNHLGFRVLPFSGFYTGGHDSRFKVYLLGLQKTQDSNPDFLEPEDLLWKVDQKLDKKNIRHSVRKRKHILQEPKSFEPEYIQEFYHTKENATLEELVLEGLK